MKSCFKGRFRLTSRRGYRNLFGATEFHKGIDLVGIDDITVYSVSDGVARTAVQPRGAGNYVTVTMPDGRRVFYMHLDRFLVQDGQKVTVGTPLGIMGSTGNSTGAHTHLELRPAGTTSESLDICAFCGIPNEQGLYSGEVYSLDDDLEILRQNGIINTPTYWQSISLGVDYLPELLRNMAAFLRNNGKV